MPTALNYSSSHLEGLMSKIHIPSRPSTNLKKPFGTTSSAQQHVEGYVGKEESMARFLHSPPSHLDPDGSQEPDVLPKNR